MAVSLLGLFCDNSPYRRIAFAMMISFGCVLLNDLHSPRTADRGGVLPTSDPVKLSITLKMPLPILSFHAQEPWAWNH